MGISLMKYLNEVRISHAGWLLTKADLTIAEVMSESGFTNQTMFNRLFKELYGVTPRQAKNHKQESPSTFQN